MFVISLSLSTLGLCPYGLWLWLVYKLMISGFLIFWKSLFITPLWGLRTPSKSTLRPICHKRSLFAPLSTSDDLFVSAQDDIAWRTDWSRLTVGCRWTSVLFWFLKITLFLVSRLMVVLFKFALVSDCIFDLFRRLRYKLLKFIGFVVSFAENMFRRLIMLELGVTRFSRSLCFITNCFSSFKSVSFIHDVTMWAYRLRFSNCWTDLTWGSSVSPVSLPFGGIK